MSTRLLVRVTRTGLWVLAALVVGVSSLTLFGSKGAAAQGGVVPSPDTWVAFTAKATQTSPNGIVVGRFYQWPDGSSRLETGPTEGDMRLIDIKNIELERWYGFVQGRGWVEHPMKLRFKPQPTKLLAASLEGTNRVTIEGMEAFQRSFPDGRVEVVVPALNFWVVDRVTLGGSRTRFHDIKVGEVPERTLLLPPVGEQVRFSDEPRGIIQRGPEDVEIDQQTGKVRFK